MTGRTDSAKAFKAVYKTAGLYDTVLLPHFFHGVEDTDLIADLMAQRFGAPSEALRVAEIGCGTGRITARLAPYAGRLLAVDSSPAMLDALGARFPQAEKLCADARQAAADLLAGGAAGDFDVVGAFWSLSYPLGECFEELTADGIRPVADQEAARRQAAGFVADLVALVAEGGHLLVLFFDADTPEQRLVTHAWETIAPFPDGGRGYTLRVLLDGLRAAEDQGAGSLTHTRIGGSVLAPDRRAALEWFNRLHFKDLPALVGSEAIQTEVATFVDARAEAGGGEVVLPSGVHVIDFHVAADRRRHLPADR